MPERSELSNAIISAADREYSSFKDIIGNALEQRFRDKINAISKEKAQKMFNPEFEPAVEDPETDEDPAGDEKPETDEGPEDSEEEQEQPEDEEPEEEQPED